MRASQDRLRRWALPGDDSRRTLWIRRLRNVDSDTSSERPAWRLAAGERRCRGKGRCRTVSPTASVQLPHRRSPASSAYHGDPESPAGGGRPPGRRLALETSANGVSWRLQAAARRAEDIDDLYV